MDIKPSKNNPVRVSAAKPGRAEGRPVSGQKGPASKKPDSELSMPPPDLEPAQDSLLAKLHIKKSKHTKRLKWCVAAILALVLVIAVSFSWLYTQTFPADPKGTHRRVNIEKGSGPREIAATLEESGIIRSAFVFDMYTRYKGLQSKLQAGTYVLSPSQSLADIVNHLVEGKVDPLNITIVPGLSLKEMKEALKKYGYSGQEIDTALNQKYDHPLLADKPADASLEGYIFPETYQIEGASDVSSLFKRSFDEFYEQLQEQNIIHRLKEKGMNLHQGVILASIVQQEVADPQEQKQVSQVFQKRLGTGMALESDATFVYAAKQMGVEPSVNLDSPYNTRKVQGLTPGPIANFNFSAIDAVVNPAPGDYVYFVSGDDGKTYFAITQEEHNANIQAHCKKLCQMF